MMDQPSAEELVTAVREFIEKHAMPQLNGRTAFHARVAANALAIVERQLRLGGALEAVERKGLDALQVRGSTIEEQNRELCRVIRKGQIDVNDPALRQHLIETTLLKVAIDQPNYSGYVHSPFKSA